MTTWIHTFKVEWGDIGTGGERNMGMGGQGDTREAGRHDHTFRKTNPSTRFPGPGPYAFFAKKKINFHRNIQT